MHLKLNNYYTLYPSSKCLLNGSKITPVQSNRHPETKRECIANPVLDPAIIQRMEFGRSLGPGAQGMPPYVLRLVVCQSAWQQEQVQP
jgi:hypothetical protein